ncbi:hypothetical protein F4781DRAFT_407471 [Annulohypoxylon bovei var. microspora]|nr:hypothetical protein F4781DRAFT_407471 [Annulohypoxylon bovei var. microspora]
MSPAPCQQASSEAEAKRSTHLKDSVQSIQITPGKSLIAKKSPSSASDPKSRKKSNQPGIDGPPRDLATGRILVDDCGSCLRCIEKGLNCTLNFLGIEGVDKCAACKRSGAQYCIRQRSAGKLISFRGLPWRNPNYFAVGDEPSPKEMEEILREHYEGQDIYMNGEFICEGDRNRIALPPLNGSDLPLDERMENWKTADWKRVLPIWKNKSIYGELNGQSPSQSDVEEAKSYGSEDRQGFTAQGTLNYFRVTRNYRPRVKHLQEFVNDLGETW